MRSDEEQMRSDEEQVRGAMTFRYFAYGSNLLLPRLQTGGSTSARRLDIAKLQDYELSFFHHTKRASESGWRGAIASIRPAEGGLVWGAVYDIDDNQRQDLDRQEGVHLGTYRSLTVDVTTPSGQVMNCRTYILNVDLDAGNPSPYYKQMIVEGAISSQLPDEYILKLKEIESNSYTGECELYDRVREQCRRAGYELPDMRGGR